MIHLNVHPIHHYSFPPRTPLQSPLTPIPPDLIILEPIQHIIPQRLPREIPRPDAALIAHLSENAPLLEQVPRRIQLHHMALIHDADPIVIDNRPQPMGDAQQRLALESRLHRPLDPHVGLHVQRRRRLVADDDLRIPHQCAREGHELALPEGEVGALFFDDVVEVDVA